MAGWLGLLRLGLLRLGLASGRAGRVRGSATICSGGPAIRRLATGLANLPVALGVASRNVPAALAMALELALELALEERRAD
jgi:hypothetical protein